jgi:hypothetical protein
MRDQVSDVGRRSLRCEPRSRQARSGGRRRCCRPCRDNRRRGRRDGSGARWSVPARSDPSRLAPSPASVFPNPDAKTVDRLAAGPHRQVQGPDYVIRRRPRVGDPTGAETSSSATSPAARPTGRGGFGTASPVVVQARDRTNTNKRRRWRIGAVCVSQGIGEEGGDRSVGGRYSVVTSRIVSGGRPWAGAEVDWAGRAEARQGPG